MTGRIIDQPRSEFHVQWFNPATGDWPRNTTVQTTQPALGDGAYNEGSNTMYSKMTRPKVVYLAAPSTGDWVAIVTGKK